MEYEEKLKTMTEEQLVYERVILLKQFNIIKVQLSLYDEECKRRLNKKCSGI